MCPYPSWACVPLIDIGFGNVKVAQRHGLLPSATNSMDSLASMGRTEMFWPALFLGVVEIWSVNCSLVDLVGVMVSLGKRMQPVVFEIDSMSGDRFLCVHFSVEKKSLEMKFGHSE